MRPLQSETRFVFRRGDLLRWLYLGRATVVTGILAGAFLKWFAAEPEQTLVAVVVFLSSYAFTGGSFWYTHLLGREAGDNFFYAQVLFDALLVTAIVHITGAGGSPFVFLYILVISTGALLLPLPGGVLVGGLATILFFADTVALHLETFSIDVLLQVGLFATVAVITGLLGDRVRRAGLALGEVESALRRLRLDTGDILANIATGVLTVDGDGRLAYLNPAGEVLLGFIREEEPAPALFDLTLEGLTLLSTSGVRQVAPLLISLELHALRELGFAPALMHCAVCATEAPTL